MNDMDAQNAAESDQTKVAADPSPPQQQPDGDLNKIVDEGQQQQTESDSRDTEAAQEQTSTKLKTPPPEKDAKPQPSAVSAAAPAPTADDAIDGRDSDAETIVLPGKDGHSPPKPAK